MIVGNCTLIKALHCNADETLDVVAGYLREYKQRRIIVVDKDQVPIGIISTTDMNNKIVAQNKLPSECVAKDIMTSPLYLTCDLTCNLNDIYKKMIEKQSYFVPVTKEGKLFAVLTYGELKKRIKEVVSSG